MITTDTIKFNKGQSQPYSMRLLILLCLCLLSSCSNSLAKYDAMMYRGQSQQALKFAAEEVSDSSMDRFMWLLQQAQAARATGDLDLALQLFDQAEQLLNDIRLVSEGKLAGRTAMTVLLNDRMRVYEGFHYEWQMINTYKALIHLSRGEFDNARVEINRANERQRKAAEFFGDELVAKREQAQASQVSKSASSQKANFSMAKINENAQLQKMRKDLRQWGTYGSYVNPLASWLEGIYLLNKAQDPSDWQRCLESLRRARGMTTLASIDADIEAAEQQATPQGKVWVLIENGQGPRLDEMRIDLPLFAFTRHIYYSGIALPKLTRRSSPMLGYAARNGKDLVSAQQLLSIDRMAATDFDKRWNGILLRAASSALLKTAAQYAAIRNDQEWLGIVLAIFQAATTRADDRIWTGLPKDFQLLSLPWQPQLDLTDANGKSYAKFPLPEEKGNYIIWVRVINAQLPPQILVLPLNKVKQGDLSL